MGNFTQRQSDAPPPSPTSYAPKTFDEAVAKIEKYNLHTFYIHVEDKVTQVILEEYSYSEGGGTGNQTIFSFSGSERLEKKHVFINRNEIVKEKETGRDIKTIDETIKSITRISIDNPMEAGLFHIMVPGGVDKKRISDFLNKLFKRLEEMKAKLHVEKLKIEMQNGCWNRSVVNILRYLKSGTLKSIELVDFFNDPPTDFDAIINQEIWQNAEQLTVSTVQELAIPMNSYWNFDTFSITFLPRFTVGELKELIEHLKSRRDSFKKGMIGMHKAYKVFRQCCEEKQKRPWVYKCGEGEEDGTVLKALVTDEKITFTLGILPETFSNDSEARLLE